MDSDRKFRWFAIGIIIVVLLVVAGIKERNRTVAKNKVNTDIVNVDSTNADTIR